MADWEVARSSGQCSGCEIELAPGDAYYAALFEAEESFERKDYCPKCWEALSAERFCFWKSCVPTPEKKEKKNQLVDNAVLINFFERLDQQEDPMRVRFRFVLALILMRKKLLRYEQTTKKDDTEYWRMRLPSADSVHEVINPKMDDEQIAEVSTQLGVILRGGTPGDSTDAVDQDDAGDAVDQDDAGEGTADDNATDDAETSEQGPETGSEQSAAESVREEQSAQ